MFETFRFLKIILVYLLFIIVSRKFLTRLLTRFTFFLSCHLWYLILGRRWITLLSVQYRLEIVLRRRNAVANSLSIEELLCTFDAPLEYNVRNIFVSSIDLIESRTRRQIFRTFFLSLFLFSFFFLIRFNSLCERDEWCNLKECLTR